MMLQKLLVCQSIPVFPFRKSIIMRNTIQIILCTVLCLSAAPLWAQLDDEGSELLRPFRAQLEQSEKLNAEPLLPDTEGARANLKYEVPTHLLSLDYPAPTLKPKSMRPDPLPMSRGLYGKAGIGLPLATLLELSYHQKKANEWDYGATLKHQTASGQLENQRFSQNGLSAYVRRFLPNGIALGANGGLQLEGRNFYGYDADSISFDRDSVRQLFTNIDLGVELFNSKKNKQDLNYAADLDFYRFSDRYEARETGISLTGGLEKWFQEKHELNVQLGLHYNSFADSLEQQDTVNQNRVVAGLRPYYQFHSDLFKIKLGANFGISEGNFFIFPDVEARFSPIKDKISIYAGATGSIRRNTFRNLARYNPFIHSVMNLRHTSYREYYGGIEGNFGEFSLDAKAFFAPSQDLPLFINDPFDFRRFYAVYDTVRTFGIQGTVHFKVMENLSLDGWLRYNAYDLNNLERAYHLPVLESNVAAVYTYEKFRIEADLFFNTGVPYVDEGGTDEMLGALIDFNLSLRYQFSDKVAAFIDGNNLFNNRNQRWFRYPQIGINGMAGVQVRL